MFSIRYQLEIIGDYWCKQDGLEIQEKNQCFVAYRWNVHCIVIDQSCISTLSKSKCHIVFFLILSILYDRRDGVGIPNVLVHGEYLKTSDVCVSYIYIMLLIEELFIFSYHRFIKIKSLLVFITLISGPIDSINQEKSWH